MVLLIKENSRNLPLRGFVVRVSGRDPGFRRYIGVMQGSYRGHIGIMEKTMETTIGFRCLAF